MLSTSENLIVIDGQIRTNIDSCRWDTMGRCHIVFSGRTKEYTYGSNRVLWLTNPERYALADMYRVVHRGKILTNISLFVQPLNSRNSVDFCRYRQKYLYLHHN